MKQTLPAYSSSLDAYHRAFAKELQAMVADLPLCSGDAVLDMGCGDGVYTTWLAQEVAPGGTVTAVDVSPAYLARARRRLRSHPQPSAVRFIQGDIQRLPFPDGVFDVAWCAQSFYSFPDPQGALTELARVVRPGGIVAVLENDTLHQVLLPWPVEVEVALCAAEFRAFCKKSERPRKFYLARNLRALLAHAGLKPQRKTLYASQREVPLGGAEIEFLTLYLRELRRRAFPHLSIHWRRRAEPLFNPKSTAFILRRPDLTLTCLDHVVWGKKSNGTDPAFHD